MRISITLRWLLLLPVVALLETACGPIRSTSGLIAAKQAIADAEAENADSAALYEMTLAREYLRKGNEELGYNDYYMAEQLYIKSEQLAVTALEKVLGTEVIEDQDQLVPLDDPDLELIPEEGELDPNRRKGDEEEIEDLLEQEDTLAPEEPATPAPTEPPAGTATPTTTTTTTTTTSDSSEASDEEASDDLWLPDTSE